MGSRTPSTGRKLAVPSLFTMRPLLLAALVALPLAAAGCDTTREEIACTLIGCSDALTVRVATADPPADGYYLVRATGDSVRACAFRLVGCAEGQCPTHVGSGCQAISVDDRISVTLAAVRGPLHIEVLFNGTPLASGSGVAVYEPQYPNGVRCGAVCEVARVTVGGL